MDKWIDLTDSDCTIINVREGSIEMRIKFADVNYWGNYEHATAYLTKQDLLNMLKLLEENEK